MSYSRKAALDVAVGSKQHSCEEWQAGVQKGGENQHSHTRSVTSSIEQIYYIVTYALLEWI
jgi:hypothetical protein